jgi:hypothetical protein
MKNLLLIETLRALGATKLVARESGISSVARKQLPTLTDKLVDTIVTQNTNMLVDYLENSELAADMLLSVAEVALTQAVKQDTAYSELLFKLQHLTGNLDTPIMNQLRIETKSRSYYKQYVKYLITEDIRSMSNFDKLFKDIAKYINSTKDSVSDIYNELRDVASLKEVITEAMIACIPSKSGKTLYNVASIKIGMRLWRLYTGDIIPSPSTYIELGQRVLIALDKVGVLEVIKTVEDHKPHFYIELDYRTVFGLSISRAIDTLNHTNRNYPMIVKPSNCTYRNYRYGYLTQDAKISAANPGVRLSKSTVDAINHRSSTKLSIFTFEDDSKLFNEYITEYCKLQHAQVQEAQRKLTKEWASTQHLPEDDRRELLILSKWTEPAFLKELNFLLAQGSYYVLAKTCDRTRIYDANNFGFQADKFIRHLIRFEESVMDGKARKQTEEYRLRVLEELDKLGSRTDLKSRKEYLGLKVKLAQLDYDLKHGVCGTPIEKDGRNSGVQVYATGALKSKRVGKYGGLDPEIIADAYKELTIRLNDIYGLTIETGFVRNDGKKPVMVFIYGAGKQAITLKGGADWEGIYYMLTNFGVVTTPEEVWGHFSNIMSEILPGVPEVMQLINSNHSSNHKGVKLTDRRVVYRWKNLVGSTVKLELTKTIDIQTPMRHDAFKTAKGNDYTLYIKTTDYTPDAKHKALSPLVNHSNDAGGVVIVVNEFAAVNAPIGTVHDGFFVRATELCLLDDSYKKFLITLNDSNIYAEILADINPFVSSEDKQAQIDHNIEVLNSLRIGDILTTEDILNSNPLSW